MLIIKARRLLINIIRLRQHLQPGVLPCQSATLNAVEGLVRSGGTHIRANVVEEELSTSRALDKDTASELNLLGLVALAVLEVRELLLKVANVVRDMELSGP